MTIHDFVTLKALPPASLRVAVEDRYPRCIGHRAPTLDRNVSNDLARARFVRSKYGSIVFGRVES